MNAHKRVIPDYTSKLEKMDSTYSVILDPEYGYKRLDPVPDEATLSEFYQNRYYELIRAGKRAADIRKLSGDGESAKQERNWLYSTIFRDILSVLEQQNAFERRSLLDVGCGTGDFLSFMHEIGWITTGLELSPDGAGMARRRGFDVRETTIENFARFTELHGAFSAVSMLCVLEHVPSPALTLQAARKLLCEKGLVVIKVPNDYNVLQLAAQKKLACTEWWINIPDHINYFSHVSLSNLLDACGFEVVDAFGDFPMELFLLMGENYLAEPETGASCHMKRMKFEMSIPDELRREIYRSLLKQGIGRNCYVFGRRTKGT